MAGSLNKVMLIGNLGRDPEVRRTQAGEPVVNLRIATSEQWRDKATGDKREKTEWHSVVIFNENLARVAENYLRKGTRIYVEGQLQTRKWTDQQGQERYSTEIVISRFRGDLQILSARGEDGGGVERLEDSGAGRAPASAGEGKRESFELDDDIPF